METKTETTGVGTGVETPEQAAAKMEAEQAKAEAEKASAEAEKARTAPLPVLQPAPKPVDPPPPPPVRARHEDGGRCCCHPFTRTWLIATVIAIVVAALGAGLYHLARSPQPPASAPQPSIYRVVPDAAGNPTLKKVSGLLWSLIGGVAYAEDKAVAVPASGSPSVVIYDDKTKDLARAEAALQKAEADKAKVEKELAKARTNATNMASQASVSESERLKAKAKVDGLKRKLKEMNAKWGVSLLERDNAREALKKAELAAAREDGITARAKEAVTVVGLQLGYGQLGQVETAAGGAGKLIPRTEKATLIEPIFGGGGNRVTVREISEPAGASGHVSNYRCAGTEVSVVDGHGGAAYYCAPAPAFSSALTVPAPPEPEASDSKHLQCLGWAAVGAAGGGGGDYVFARGFDRDVNAKDVAAGAFLGAAITYGGCLIFSR